MEIISKINLLIESAECWCCAGSFNVPRMHRARRLGNAWGAETEKSPFSIPWDSAWNRDNKCYLFEVNVFIWGLIDHISWNLCPFLSAARKDTVTLWIKIYQSLLREAKILRCLFWFCHFCSWPGTSYLWFQLWEGCCPIVCRVRLKLLGGYMATQTSLIILLVTAAPIVLWCFCIDCILVSMTYGLE